MEVYNNSNVGMANINASDKNSISMDDFLKIMAAEIQNQSPMGGGEGGGGSTSYISQLAQINSLEQMTKISDSISLLTLMGQQQYSFSLIGKEVTVQEDEGTYTGIVEKIRFVNGLATLEIKGKEYYLGSVIEVGIAESEDNE